MKSHTMIKMAQKDVKKAVAVRKTNKHILAALSI